MAAQGIRPRFSAQVAAAVLFGLGGAGVLFMLVGAGRDNSSLFGVPMGYQTPPIPKGDWRLALAKVADAHGFSEFHIETDNPRPMLGYTLSPRQAFYRATITGDGRRVDVLLVARDGGEWTLKEWRE